MAKSQKQVQQDLIANMRSWQKVENSSVASTGRVIEKTENPIVRLVMEIIGPKLADALSRAGVGRGEPGGQDG